MQSYFRRTLREPTLARVCAHTRVFDSDSIHVDRLVTAVECICCMFSRLSATDTVILCTVAPVAAHTHANCVCAIVNAMWRQQHARVRAQVNSTSAQVFGVYACTCSPLPLTHTHKMHRHASALMHC